MHDYLFEREEMKRDLHEILDAIAKEEEKDDDEVVADVEAKAGMSEPRIRMLMLYLTLGQKVQKWTEKAKSEVEDREGL